MKPSSNKNTSVFLDGDLSHAEAQRRGENVGRKERIDRKAWTHVRLGNYATLLAGGTPSRSVSDYYGGSIPWCSISDISGAGKFLIRTAESLTRLGIENSTAKLIPADAILFAMYASIGECALATTPLATSQAILGIYNLKEFDREYLYYYLCSQKEVFINQGQTGTQSNLSKEIVSNIQVPKPSIKEQRRIANSLSSIDANIATVQSLFSKYEAIKKATVNLLLEPGAGWQKIKFGDVCSSFEYGVGAPAMSFDGRNKYIRITDIDDNSHEFKPTPLSSPTFFDNNHVVRDGDILLARTGASVGKSYLYRPIDGKLIFAGFLIRASICTKIADPQFVFLQTLTSRYRHWVSEESMRSGQPGLNINQYKDFELYLPELAEQRKIAAQISAIDNVLKDCRAQLAKAQSLRQGMMSYFFG